MSLFPGEAASMTALMPSPAVRGRAGPGHGHGYRPADPSRERLMNSAVSPSDSVPL